jgi:hypothetical protein
VEKYRFRTILCLALREARSGITEFCYVSENVLVSNETCTLQLRVRKQEDDITDCNRVLFLYVGQ